MSQCFTEFFFFQTRFLTKIFQVFFSFSPVAGKKGSKQNPKVKMFQKPIKILIKLHERRENFFKKFSSKKESLIDCLLKH